MFLHAQDRVEQSRADRTEPEDGQPVTAPVLLLTGIGSDEPVEATLDGPNGPRRPGGARTPFGHPEAERIGEDEQDAGVDEGLAGALTAHAGSRALSAWVSTAGKPSVRSGK